MPYYLKEIEDMPELAKFNSVLIIPCRFCPAASMAVSKNEPYIELFRGLLKTAAYEEFIKTIKCDLEKKGVKTDIFRSRVLHQFVLCSWTEKRRDELSDLADKYEAATNEAISAYMADVEKKSSSYDELLKDLEPADQQRAKTFTDLIELRERLIESLSPEEWEKVFG